MDRKLNSSDLEINSNKKRFISKYILSENFWTYKTVHAQKLLLPEWNSRSCEIGLGLLLGGSRVSHFCYHIKAMIHLGEAKQHIKVDSLWSPYICSLISCLLPKSVCLVPFQYHIQCTWKLGPCSATYIHILFQQVSHWIICSCFHRDVVCLFSL